jgi:hypothetical protein
MEVKRFECLGSFGVNYFMQIVLLKVGFGVKH